MINRDSLSDVLFSVIVIVALYVWNQSATVAIICGTLAYMGMGTIRTVATSEPLRDMYMQHATQVTTRRYHTLQYQMQQLPLADPAQPGYLPPTDTLPARFVPKYDPAAVAEAAAYAYRLFDADGKLDRAKVLGPGSKRPGQVQLGKPAAPILDVLTDMRIVRPFSDGMLEYIADPTLTRQEVMLAIQRGGGMQT